MNICYISNRLLDTERNYALSNSESRVSVVLMGFGIIFRDVLVLMESFVDIVIKERFFRTCFHLGFYFEIIHFI